MSYSNAICTQCYRCPGHHPSYLGGGEACNDCLYKPIFHALSFSQTPSNLNDTHNNNGVPNQHIFPLPQNAYSSNYNSMSPFHPFVNDNVTPQPCHQTHASFNQAPIVSSNVQGVNGNATNMNHNTTTMHRFQQQNSSVSDTITSANPSMNTNSSCQHFPQM